MADKANGTIKAVARSGKSFMLDDDNWYSVFNASQMNGCDKGDSVSFSYKTNGRYKNVQGNVTKEAGGSSAGGSGKSGGGSRGGRTYRANGEEGGFPIHPLAYERALDRRNAVAAAAQIVAAQIKTGKELEHPEDFVLDMARAFEAYSTGDEDAAAMVAMMETGGGDE